MSIATPIRIGTRKSPLALAQAEEVRRALLAAYPHLAPDEVTLAPMLTTGDKNPSGHFGQWGYKGLFTKELEECLYAGTVDLAVHSMKDMPSVLPEGLVIAAVLEREDARDAFVSLRHAALSDMPQGAAFGTSSVRRGAQIRRLRPDLNIVEMRGNVQTRLSKLESGQAEATLLAVAGLNRLGLAQHITQILPMEQMLPAVAQGAIGIECRETDREFFAVLEHTPTRIALEAERGFLAALDGSCSTPLAAHAVLEGSYVRLSAEVIACDGSGARRETIMGPHADAARLGHEIGAYLKHHAAHWLG